jgi:hypothetical protein
MSESKYLPTYLKDHLAGAVAGVQLARRVEGENRDSEYGEPLARLAEEINEDRHALQDLMKRLEIGGDAVKILAAVGAERVGRLKLNGELRRYSPLSRLEELEVLLLAVEGKVALWRALRTALADDARVGELNFDQLIKRGTSQRQRLNRLRAQAVEEAFGG